MVVWLMRGFFLLLAVALLAWAAEGLWNRSRPLREVAAVVEQKSWTTFPRTMISMRRDQKDCVVGFQLPEEGRLLSLCVPEDVFEALSKQQTGKLTYRGSRFRSFACDDGTLIRHVPQGRPPQED